jgi:mannose-6-phosphate isomerase-like protein (cupin superfamily)
MFKIIFSRQVNTLRGILKRLQNVPHRIRRAHALSRWSLRGSENPDEVRTFEKGKFEVVHVGGMTIGRATYQPGWKWSLHVGKAVGASSCVVEHVGMVVSGRATAAMDDGRVIEMKAGDVFYIAPGHDSWVVGDKPYVSLHFMGASEYAQAKR